YDNLKFPFEVRSEEINNNKILDLLNKFNLDESFLNKDINSLSGGEKQRIALMRNLVYMPEVLLLDEATSALDRENANRIEGIIKDINNKGVTVVWITHSLEQSENIFNKRITMESGKIIKAEVF
ncbi:MAG: ABC transporter ATP-binding protein, partial [Clostridium sp.]